MTHVPVILCFGDSNTHGTPPMHSVNDLDRFARHERWPGVVQNSLGQCVQIIEEAQPGRTTIYDDPTAGGDRNGLTALRVALDSHRPVDCVVLMLGTNDLHARLNLSPWVISLNMKQLILKIRQMPCGPDHGTAPKILLVAPTPVKEVSFAAAALDGAEAKSQQFGRYFGALAQEMGVDFIDAGEIIEVDPLDGVHFSVESHRKLGEAIATKLQGMMALDPVLSGS